jgi:flagellar hook-basal body complex protein FliE
MPAIDPSFATSGPDWSVALDGGIDRNGLGVDDSGSIVGKQDFGGVLGQQLQNLADMQTQAADASTALATGTATDPASTVMAVERARLSMQLASTLRTKGVEAITEIFHTQV